MNQLQMIKISHFRRYCCNASIGQKLSTSIQQQEEIHNSIATIINNVNPMEPALEQFAPFLTPHIVNRLITESTWKKKENSRGQLGFRFFVWAMRKPYLRNWVTHNLMIDEMVSGKDGFDDLYWKVFDDVKRCGFYIDAVGFNVLIEAYARLGLAEKAVEAFGKMVNEYGVTPSPVSFNCLLHVLMGRRIALLGMAVYNMMIKVNCEPNLATFGILIDGLCKCRRTVDALRMFDEMLGKGIKPNGRIFTSVISGLCRAEKLDDAFRLLGDMKESGVNPDSVTFNALINGYSRLGRMDEAFALLPLFDKDEYVLDLRGYSCLIDGYFEARRFDEALKLYGEMIEKGIKPDVTLYTILIKGLIVAGRLEDGLKLLKEMTDNGVIPGTYCYNAVIKGFCDAGILDEARSLQLEISEKGSFPNTCTYTILICGMCKNGLHDEARKIFNEMEKLGCLPSVVTFNALMDGLCKASELDKARLLLYQMEIGRNPSVFLRITQGANKVFTGESLMTMVEKLCESGLILKAYKILMKLADSVMPDVKIYTILVKGFCKAENFDVAIKLFKEMQIKGIYPDVITYGTLIEGLVKAGRVDDAIMVINQMEKNGFLPTLSVYRILMTQLSKKKDIFSAFHVWMMYLRKLPGHDLRTIEAAERHFKEGKIDQAVLGLIRMNFRFNNFEQGTYTILLIGLLQGKKYEHALKLFYILREFEIDVTAACCWKLIHCLCREQHLDLATEVFLYSLEKGFTLSPRVCNYLLHSLLRSKVKEAQVLAIDLASKMESAGYNLHAHLPRVTKRLLKHLSSLDRQKHECSQSKTSLSQAWFASWKGKVDCLQSKTTPALSRAQKNKPMGRS